MSSENVTGTRPACTTADCDGMATHKALVALDDRDEWFPYCWDCAESVSDDETPPVELIFVDEPDPYDPDDLVKWAVKYGHPEEWAKRAQTADARAHRGDCRVADLERALRQVVEHPSLAVQIASEALNGAPQR